MTNVAKTQRAHGPGYRDRIRELSALGVATSEIRKLMPGLRASEIERTLAISPRRGRPLKKPTVHSITAVKRWRATQRPRTMRAALECIDFLLSIVEADGHSDLAADEAVPSRTLPGFS